MKESLKYTKGNGTPNFPQMLLIITEETMALIIIQFHMAQIYQFQQ